MSQVVDTKVVEMQFDNSKFEKNIQTSLNSLKFLNKNIDEAGKNRGSLDNLAKAGDQVGIAFDNMNMKSKISLNLMDMIAGVGTKAFNRISDAVAGFALNMANSLSGMQAMRDGFNEYELKMGSVQTMLVGAKIIDPKTLKATEDESRRLEIINDELEKLNEYSDKTVYSFKDMTSNIGKFTNNGVELHDAVDAIQGVANVAAAAGANSQEASRAMYNFSQALSSGAVKLIDWKSIENANMATQGFKQQLLDTALVFGTVTKEGKEYKTTTTDLQGKISDAFTTTKGFNDSLSHQWMTTEVLTQTLKNYSTDVRYMSDTALEKYRESLIKLGYTSKQVDRIIETSRKAFEAATEVKTFSQMIDTLKESLGSGWAQTWEIVIGDFREAKALFTGLNGAIESILSPIGEARNAILKMWKKDGGRQALINSFVNLFYAVKNLLEPIKQLWIAFTPNTSHIGKGLATISKWIENITAVVRKGSIVVGRILAGLMKPLIFIGNFVGKQLVKLVGVIRNAFHKIVAFFAPVRKAITIFSNTIKEAFDKHIISRVKLFQSSIANAFNNLKTHVKNSAVLAKLIDAFNKLKSVIQDLFGRVTSNAGLYAREFIGYLKKIYDAVAPLISSAVTKAIKTLADILLPRLSKALNWVADRLRDLGNYLKKLNFKNTGLYKALSEIPDKIKEISNNKTIKSIFSSIKGFGSEAVSFLSEKFRNLKSDIEAIKMPGGLRDLFDNIKNFIRSIFGKDSVKDELTNSLENAIGSTDKLTEGASEGKLTAFQKFLAGIADAFDWLKNAANTAKDAIERFIKFVISYTPKGLKTLHDFLAGDDGILTITDVTDAMYIASTALSDLLTSFGFQSIGKGLGSIGEAFGDLTLTLNNFFKQSANKARMSAIKDFAIAIGILTGALYILSKIPTQQLIGAVSALGIVGLGLVKFFDQISSTDFTAVKVAGNLSLAALLTSIGVAMAGIAISVAALVGALALFPKVIKQYNDLGDTFTDGMKRVAKVLGQMFEYLDHSLRGKYALRSAIALFVLVKTLKSMRQVIVDFANEETGNAMLNGMLRIQQIINMLGKFLQSVTLVNFAGINIGINLNTLGIAAMIWALGDLLTKIVPVIEKAGAIPISDVTRGMDVIEKILWRFGIFLTAMNAGSLFKIVGGGTSLRQWIGISLTIALITNAISSIVGDISTLAKLASGEAAKGFDDAVDTIQGIFIGLILIMGVIGHFKPTGGGTLFMLSVSIGLLVACVVALTPLAEQKPHALAGAVGAVGGLMIALGAALWLAHLASGKTSWKDIILLLALVGGMFEVSMAIRRLAKTGGSAGNIIAAGAAIGGAVLAMAGAMYLLGKVPKIPLSVLAGLLILTAAIWGIVFAIRAFKGSANDMSSASTTIKSSVDKTVDDTGTALEEGMNSRLKMIDLSGIVGPIMEKIGEKLGNFDLGSYLRNAFEKVKADAKNWAQDALDIGSNIISGLSEALSNPANIERIKEDMKALGKALLDAFKSFLGINSPSTVMIEQGGYIIDGLVQGLMEYPSKLAEWASGIGQFIIDGVSGLFSSAVEKGKTLVEGIGNGIQNGKDFVVEKATKLGKAAVNGVSKVNEWGKQATASANAFGSKLQKSKNPVKRAAGTMIVGATTAVKGLSKSYKQFASTAASKFSSEIKAGSNPAKAAAKAMVTSAKAAFNNIRSSFLAYGKNAAEGFRSGINNLIASVAEKAREMVRRAKNAAKSEQHSNSPSKDFMEYGGWAAEGYAIGMANRQSSSLIERNAQAMVDSAKNVVSGARFGAGMYFDSNSAIDSLAYAMAQISDTMNSGVNANPTIRPVVDMSNVNRGVSTISGLFGDEQMRASLNATTQIQSDFNSAMANRNGLSSVRAIDKLTKRIDGMTESMNSRSLNVYNTIDGAADPEAFADGLIRSFRLNARTV